MSALKMILKWLWQQKWRGLIIAGLVPIFLLILFPLGDLSDFVTSRVSTMTNNQVYVQFNEMSFNLVPDLGLRFDKFSIETPALPPLNVQKLSVSPSIMSLVTQRPAGSLSADGIFRGEATVTVKPGKKAENGASTEAITIQAEKLQVADIRQFLSLPVMVKGSANVNADGIIDLSLSNQPDVSFDLQSGKLEMASSVINLPLGPLVLPDLNLSRINLKGRLSAGNLSIEEALLGKEGDELIGKISGQLGLEIRGAGTNIVPMQGAYNYKIDLWASKEFEDKAKLFLMIVDKYRQPEGKGARYKFTVFGDARTGKFETGTMR